MGRESERGQEVAAVEVYLSAYCEIHSYKVNEIESIPKLRLI
jgi:hypothetical protein